MMKGTIKKKVLEKLNKKDTVFKKQDEIRNREVRALVEVMDEMIEGKDR